MLKFPNEYQKNCPFVIFSPKVYSFPFGDGSKTKPTNTDSYPGIEQISLYLPGTYKENAQATWGSQNILGGMGEGVVQNVGNEVMNSMAQAFGKKITSTIAATNGYTSLPMDLLVYEGPVPISISFSFNFIPTSLEENQEIYKIIRTFKTANAPTLGKDTANSMILKYPPIWDIDFKQVKGMGFNLSNAYSFMALESVDVSYAGDTNMFIYNDTDNEYPVQTNLSLTFKSIKKFQV